MVFLLPEEQRQNTEGHLKPIGNKRFYSPAADGFIREFKLSDR